jgi:hypothetical protein
MNRETILATADFFGASDNDLAQIKFDLGVARYRVFDWLAMGVMGRIDNRQAVRVFVHSLLKVNGDVTAFIDDLRVSDYDIDRVWENMDLGDEEGGSK